MALAVGTDAPNFTTTNDQGKEVSLSDFAGKTVVLYFYPKDDTPGCTKEAQSFKEQYDEYQKNDIVILGVSMDGRASHVQFKKKYGLPFQLLGDRDGILSKAYDVDAGGYSKRVTYVINGDGKISHVDTAVKTETHAKDVLCSIGVEKQDWCF